MMSNSFKITIGILCVIVVSALILTSRCNTCGKKSLKFIAKHQLYAVKAAIQQYKAENMSLPPSGNKQLLAALTGRYLNPGDLFTIEDGELIDPFGFPYIYNVPARCNRGEYDLYSVGPNGRDERGLADDLVVWSWDKGRTVAELLDGLKSENDKVRGDCAIALGRRGEKSAIPALVRIANNDPELLVRMVAIWALEMITGEKPNYHELTLTNVNAVARKWSHWLSRRSVE